MKVAVYTIALNEEHFVERWYESIKDADYILIADTGSTDKTVEIAKSLGINVIPISVSPWRFDDARNASLASIPLDIDYCIALDMDEIILPGWRKSLETAFSLEITRPRYQYTWSWKDAEKGLPGLQYSADKIHSRKGYRWKHPVHETVNYYGASVETQAWTDLEIHHYPDNSKPRSQYLPLLSMSVKEDPSDDRNAFYYARELFFYNKFDEAKKEFKRHLALPSAVWKPERAASMRYLSKIDGSKAIYWLESAIKESPGRREALLELAQVYYDLGDWTNTYKYSKLAVLIKEKPLDYLCEEFAWGSLAYDLAAISAYNLGNLNEAIEYTKQAITLDPDNKRFLTNLSYYYKDK